MNLFNRIIRAKRRWDREESIDMWEESDFFLTELFGLRPYEPDPEHEDWNCKFDKILLMNFKGYIYRMRYQNPDKFQFKFSAILCLSQARAAGASRRVCLLCFAVLRRFAVQLTIVLDARTCVKYKFKREIK